MSLIPLILQKKKLLGSLLNQTFIPQKLIVQQDTYVDEMSELTNFTSFQGVLSVNETEFYSGNKSIKLTSALGKNAIIQRPNLQLDLSKDNGASIQIMIYPHTAMDVTIAYFTLTVLTSPGNMFQRSIQTANIKQNQWNELRKISYLDTQFTAEWGKTGNPSWANITYIGVTVHTPSEQTSICSFDFLRAGGIKKPAVLFQFDDVPSSVYTLVYPEFTKRKMKATVYMVSNFINFGEYMTPSQLQFLNNAGWTVGNHTKSHVDLRTLTQSEIETEITDCANALAALGIDTGLHVAYPFGYWNADVSAAMLAVGALTGRGGNPDSFDLTIDYDTNQNFPYQLQWSTPADTVKAKDLLKKAKLQNLTVCIVFHGIVESGASGIERNLSDLIEILDYALSLEFQTLTIEEWYRLFSNSITVNHK